MRFVLTFMMLLVVSFVEASPAPDWVFGKGHPSYDPDQYLMGVGYSKENTVSASESARAELIKSIRVQVNSTLKDYKSTDKSFSEATISSESDFLLEGSQVKDGWYDEDKGIFYSLVVIKRQYVLDTLSELIDNIITKNSLTLRQADTFYNNGNVLKALVYYYDGYVESSKLLPYIQTYKSVIMEPNTKIVGSNYNLLFKEKIQNIVDHINLEKVSGTMDGETISLKVRATHKGRGIDNFPVKFYSVYNKHVEKSFCRSDGCGIRVAIKGILNKNNHIFMKAVVDIATLEKFFTYNLSEKLFNHFILLNVSYKFLYIKEENVAKQTIKKNEQRRAKRKRYTYTEEPFKTLEREMQAQRNRQQNRPTNNSGLWDINPPGCEVGCGVPPLRVYPGTEPRRRGNINFNIGFGKGRNRVNINIFKRW